MLEQSIKMGDAGRLVIPAAYRKLLGVKPGDSLIIGVQDGEIRIFQQKRALNILRSAVARVVGKPEGGSHVDDFLEFRKQDSGE